MYIIYIYILGPGPQSAGCLCECPLVEIDNCVVVVWYCLSFAREASRDEYLSKENMDWNKTLSWLE